ncbi:hypothetical protein EN5CB1_24440 [Tepidimicrobium xylanilyticum]|nr:hypothetical protein EN5CB1_24440 [Tepidimicrobium xylanilyticum]
MKLLILSILLIGVAGLERALYIKRYRGLDKLRLFMDTLIICLLLLISYFITDTTIGIFYVFFGIITLILIGIVNSRTNVQWLKSTSYIIGLPIISYLALKIGL